MALELRFTISGQAERTVGLDQPHMKIGALLSNQIVLRAPGVDPIHALIEETDGGDFVVTDLGSATGVKVNGRLVDVEEKLKAGDVIGIGSVNVAVQQRTSAVGVAVPVVPAMEYEEKAAVGGAMPARGNTVRVEPAEAEARRAGGDTMVGEGADAERKKDMLFSPRKARPAGDVLEVVAYWGDTVLEVELFHPTYKGFESVTIGDPNKTHLIAAGKEHVTSHTLAAFSSSGGFKVNLRSGMHARLRKGGKVEKVDAEGSVSLGNRDIAHIKYGAVSYFLMFVRPPSLNLPKQGTRDPFFLGLMSVMALLYLVLVPTAILHNAPPVKDGKEDDIWQVVQVPEKEKKPEEKKKEPEPKKPPQKIAEKKTPPKKPPKPQKPPQIKPAPVVEKEKPKQQKPVEKPVEKPVKPTQALAEKKPTPPTPTPQKAQEAKPVGPPTPNPKNSPEPPKDNNNKAGPVSKLTGVGMPSTGAKSPDFKLAGPSLPNTALGKAGGPQGSGMNQKGAPIKGTGKADFKGVEGVNNNKASGVNLSKLGLGVGKVLNQNAAGAISTNFSNSAGGAGGGMGSASKTYGMGGVGSGKSLGLAGAGGAVNNFGSGSGGFLSGQGGLGGGGGSGLSGAFGGGGGGGGGAGGKGGHGRANVTVPPGDPVVSGGLTAQEIMAVIRANLNQIRHCYEQLLQRSPNASGKMTVSFVISTAGRVQSTNVMESTISDSVMRGCVTGKIQRWSFPKPRGGSPVSVNYPFVFNPL
jgi:pSer/pThr/pTyr-binding forkhead associated (FHA) protein